MHKVCDFIVYSVLRHNLASLCAELLLDLTLGLPSGDRWENIGSAVGRENYIRPVVASFFFDVFMHTDHAKGCHILFLCTVWLFFEPISVNKG